MNTDRLLNHLLVKFGIWNNTRQWNNMVNNYGFDITLVAAIWVSSWPGQIACLAARSGSDRKCTWCLFTKYNLMCMFPLLLQVHLPGLVYIKSLLYLPQMDFQKKRIMGKFLFNNKRVSFNFTYELWLVKNIRRYTFVLKIFERSIIIRKQTMHHK